METTLPIYDNIISSLRNDGNKVQSITKEEKQTLINNINNYQDVHEIVFAIIRFYQLQHGNNITDKPFYCKYLKTKGGYKFDLDNIPNKLIRILIIFYDIHIKSINNS